MAISSFTAAKKVCELSNWTITNLKLQKILYILHLLYLGEKKEPLINDEDFEAWYYGPVLPLLYNKIKIFSDRPIQNIFFNNDIDLFSPEINFIKEHYKKIAKKSAWDLVLATHLAGGAWEKYFDHNAKNQVIPNEDILEEYKDFYV